MRKPHLGALAALLATLGLSLVLTTPVRSQRPQPRETFKAQIARLAKLEEEAVTKVLQALGPAIRDHVARGEQVDIPGLGTFRVVRVPEHKDMVNGRPATIPDSNYIEFVPVEDLVKASNAPTAVPAVVVPPYEFNPLPNQTKAQKAPGSRQPTNRIP